MFKVELKVKQEDLIPPYEHVHHADALKYLEEARVLFLDKIGFPLQGYLDNGIFLVITDIETSYLREFKGEKVTVTCENCKLDQKKIIIYQNILNQRDKLILKAKIGIAFMNSKTRRSMSPPEDFLRSFLV